MTEPRHSKRTVGPMRPSLGVLIVLLALVIVFVLGGRGKLGSDIGLNPASQPEASVASTSAPSDPTMHAVHGRAWSSVRQSPLAQDVATRAQDADVPAALSVRGRVLDDIGKPVVNFRIDAERLDLSSRRTAQPISRYFDTEDGVFALDALDAGQWEFVAHTDDGRRSAPTLTNVPEARETVIVLPRGAAITGRVIGDGESPISDAEIYILYPGEEDPDFTFGPIPMFTSLSEANGRFRIDGALPGRASVMARHTEYCEGERIYFTSTPGGIVEGLELVLSKGGRIEGFVDASLVDVQYRNIGLFSFRGGKGWRDAQTDATGHFAIERVVPQDYVMELMPPDGKPGVGDGPGIRKRISVKENETTHVVFSDTGQRIVLHGMVRVEGRPAAGLSVSSHSELHEDHGDSVKTEADGRFELTLTGAGDYTVTVTANYGSFVSFDCAVPDQSDFDVVFDVPGGCLSGRVLDLDGHALSRIPITIVRNGRTRDTFDKDGYRRDYTGSDGSFRFSLLARGSYTLRAPDGFQDDSPPPRVPYGRVMLTDLVVDRGEVGSIEMRLPREGTVSGVVVDAEGNAVTGAWLVALDEGGISLAGDGWETRSDATGHFQIENVAPGIYLVRARSDVREGKSATIEVEAGKATSVRVEIK